MARKSLQEFVPDRPEKRRRVYAYTIPGSADHVGLLKVGETYTTESNAKRRVAQQTKTAGVKTNIVVDELAEADDGSTFSDGDVRTRLLGHGHEKVYPTGEKKTSGNEWVRCTEDDVRLAITELRMGKSLTGSHHQTFKPRDEQQEAINRTLAYFTQTDNYNSTRKNGEPEHTARFLWNAKMRFGKTFTSYQLAKKLGAKRVLVLTFKPAVEDAWRTDLESHADFNGWQYASIAKGKLDKYGVDPSTVSKNTPLVYFASFQDVLGKTGGVIKAKNEWLHTITWDLVIFDEYHFGAWRERAKELFEGEDDAERRKEEAVEYASVLDDFTETLDTLAGNEDDFLPISARRYLYLSGTPFRQLANGEFADDQIFNWTYTDEQAAKRRFAEQHPDKWNPYGALPEMRLLTYQMPDHVVSVASGGEFDEFDLNAFFEATGSGTSAVFKHAKEVQEWLDIIRGKGQHANIDMLKAKQADRPPFPYSDVHLLPYLNHAFWFLPSVAACDAMANLLAAKNNTFWHDYTVIVCAGTKAGVGQAALPPVRQKIGNGHDTKTITLSCGKLTTGVTVAPWASILMLRNLKSPETYFQAAFRVQSPWSGRSEEDPNEEVIWKPVCFVFDFAPTRALRQISEYGVGLAPEAKNPEQAVEELVKFLPVLAYDGSSMYEVNAGNILDIALSGTAATLLARKWQSALLVNVDNVTLKKIMAEPDVYEAVMAIEGFRALGGDIFETVVNRSNAIKEAKTREKDGDTPSANEKKTISDEEKKMRKDRKAIQENLIKFATRIPAFMYLTDYREHTLKDVITRIEPALFKTVTGLTIPQFEKLVDVGLFNSTHMNQAVFAFRRYEDSSLAYTGINSHDDLKYIGGWDTVIARQ